MMNPADRNIVTTEEITKNLLETTNEEKPMRTTGEEVTIMILKGDTTMIIGEVIDLMITEGMTTTEEMMDTPVAILNTINTFLIALAPE